MQCRDVFVAYRVCVPDDLPDVRPEGLGQFEAKHLMLLAMALAGRLGKYGA